MEHELIISQSPLVFTLPQMLKLFVYRDKFVSVTFPSITEFSVHFFAFAGFLRCILQPFGTVVLKGGFISFANAYVNVPYFVTNFCYSFILFTEVCPFLRDHQRLFVVFFG